MVRKQVRDISAPTPLQPVAAPVNTYVRPADPAPSSLHGLAKGLAAFDSGLGGWLQKREGEQNKADAIRGAAAFNKNNRVGWAEAVRSGVVPANASPIFMEAYKQAQGSLLGVQIQEGFNTAYQGWDGKNSTDPATFDSFINNFVSNSITTDDPEILAGLLPHLNQLTEDAYKLHGKNQVDLVYGGAVNTRAALAGDTIDHASTQGLSTGEGTEYKLLMMDLIAQRQAALDSGIRQQDFDKSLVDAIVDKAVEHGDPGLLDLLDTTLPGYDVKLSSLPEFRDMKENAIDKLEVEARRRVADEYDRQVKEDRLREDTIITSVVSSLVADPNAPIPDDIIKEWQKYDPMAPTKLIDAREKILKGESTEDPRDLLHIEWVIRDGATPAQIFELVNDGIINDPATLRIALDRAKGRAKALQDNGILTNQTSKRFLATIKHRTQPDTLVAWAFDGLSDEGLQATRDFEQILIEWSELNPNAGLMERENTINEVGRLILKRVNPEVEYDNPQKYLSKEDAALIGQQAPDNTTQAGGQNETRNQRTGPPLKLFATAQPPRFKSLPKEVQRRLEHEAKDHNITAEEYALKVWKLVRRKLRKNAAEAEE